MSRRIVIAYWIVPTEPARSYFQNVINDIAQRYDAPTFEPHVTVHVGADTVDDVLSKVVRDCEQIVLQALEVSGSSEFIKTLFVQFALNRRVQRLNEIIRNAGQDSSDYQIQPHVSLIYKRMSILARCQLARSMKIPFSEVVFDSIKAVRCASPTRSSADVEAWRVVAMKALSG